MALENFNHTVRWSDFTTKESRPTGEDEDAHIEALSKAANMQGMKKDGKYKVSSIKLRLYVDKGASWAVKGTKTDELLQHEQRHFDITAIGARELHKRVLELRTDSADELIAEIQVLQTEIQELTDELNELYDDETDHSRKKARQQHWNTNINAVKKRDTGTLNELKKAVGKS